MLRGMVRVILGTYPINQAMNRTILGLITLIALSTVAATESKMNSSLDRLEQAQDKAEIEFQQIRADW
jgi:hypothetical protein